MLTHLKPQDPKNGKKMGRAQNTVKRDCFGGGEWSAAGAAAPLSYGEERNAVRQGHGQGAPGRILSAYARQPARGPTMLAHLVAMLAFVGLC